MLGSVGDRWKGGETEINGEWGEITIQEMMEA